MPFEWALALRPAPEAPAESSERSLNTPWSLNSSLSLPFLQKSRNLIPVLKWSIEGALACLFKFRLEHSALLRCILIRNRKLGPVNYRLRRHHNLAVPIRKLHHIALGQARL